MKLLELLKEDLMPTAGNNLLAQLNSAQTIQEKLVIVDSNDLAFLGEGSYRIVYRLAVGKVLKLAKDNKAIEDNKNEWDLFNCSGSDYLAKIYEHAPDFSWLISEEADKFRSDHEVLDKLKQMTGLSIINMVTLATLLTNGMIPGHRLHEYYTLAKQKSPWFKGFAEILEQCEVSAHDFNSDNLGIRKTNGKLIVIDYGFKTTS